MTLLRYEQSCSADPDTKTCAAPYDQCRDAMVEILGTNLRTNCACSGTAGDFRELFECIEYQRLFWVNPCVGKLVSLLFSATSIRSLIRICKRQGPRNAGCVAMIAIDRDFPAKG